MLSLAKDFFQAVRPELTKITQDFTQFIKDASSIEGLKTIGGDVARSMFEASFPQAAPQPALQPASNG